MTAIESRSHTKSPAKILIPIGDLVSKELITRALHVLSAFKNPLVVLLHVIEVPSRTGTLDPEPYRNEIDKAERKLKDLSAWLENQDLKAVVKVVVAQRCRRHRYRDGARGLPDRIYDETKDQAALEALLLQKRQRTGCPLRQLFGYDGAIGAIAR